MKIRFKKKRLYLNLMMGLFWSFFGVTSLLEEMPIRWFDCVYLILGILYLSHYVYDLTNQYLIIENGTIRKNILYGFGKKINLSEIHWMKEYGGDYILKTDTQELNIRSRFIEKESLTELHKILKKLNVPAERNTIC